MSENLEAKIEDLFARETFIGQIHPLIEILMKSGGAIAIHAPFGMGKSTFCDIYKKWLQEKDFRSNIINVSLHDYENEPFVPIHQHLTTLLGKNHTLVKIKEYGIKILKNLSSLNLSSIPYVGNILSEVSDEIFDNILNSSLEADINNYKNELKKLCANEKIVIFIDELDRCKADYSLKFLERLKHYFEDTPNLIFILMVNKNALSQLIKHTYGYEEPLNYIEKFLSYKIIALPLLSDEEIRKNVKIRKDRNHSHIHLKKEFDVSFPKNLLKEFEKIRDSEGNSLDQYIETASAFAQLFHLNYREQRYLIIATIANFNNIIQTNAVRLSACLIVISVKFPNLFDRLKIDDNEAYVELYNLMQSYEAEFRWYGGYEKLNGQDGEDFSLGFFSYFIDLLKARLNKLDPEVFKEHLKILEKVFLAYFDLHKET